MQDYQGKSKAVLEYRERGLYMKSVISAIEKELARKQKQLAEVEYEIDVWTNGYSYLAGGYETAMKEARRANRAGDYRKALQILKDFDKKKNKINRILAKDSTEPFRERYEIKKEIEELEMELCRIKMREGF